MPTHRVRAPTSRSLAGYMAGMTDINPAAEVARESARTSTGQFGVQARTAPEACLTDTRTAVPIITTALLQPRESVVYPAALPEGGQVGAGLEDSGGVYVWVEWEDELDEHGNPIRISLGGDDEYGSGNDWNSLSNGEPGFADRNLNDESLRYLRGLHTAIDGDAESVRYAATEPLFDLFVQRATGTEPEKDYSDAAGVAKSQERGAKLAGAFADAFAEDEDNVADAIADLLEFAKSKNLDVEGLLHRARMYTDLD